MRINLYGTIVSNDDAWFYEWFEAEHTTPKMIVDQLESAKDTDVEIYINSPGGDVWAGSLISAAIEEHGRVTVKIVGLAASAASLPLCSAAKVLIAPTAQVMIHRASTYTAGNKNDIDQTMQMLNSVDEGMVNAYEKKTGMSREEILNLMDTTTFFDAKRAVELGFADEIMFTKTENVAVSASAVPLMSAEFLSSFKEKLINANLAPGDQAKKKDPEPVANAPKNNKTPKEGEVKMTYDELVAQHPELLDTISQAAVTAERNRISSLSQMEGAPGAEPFIKAAILSGETAGDVAMKIVQASAQRQTQEGANRQADAEASGVNAVANQAPPAKQTDKEKQDAIVASLAARTAAAMQKKGGK